MLQPVFKISHSKMPKAKINQAQKIVEKYFNERFFPIQLKYIQEVDNFFYSKNGQKLVRKLDKIEKSKIPHEILNINHPEINLANPDKGLNSFIVSLKKGIKREGIESQVIEILDILKKSDFAERFQPIVDDFTNLMRDSFQKSFDILAPNKPPVKTFKFDIQEFLGNFSKIL